MTCLSDLHLDELLAGERHDDDHLAGCAPCQARSRALAAERDRFRVARPSLRRPRRWPVIAVGAMAAAALAVVVLPRDERGPRDEQGTRTKGGAHLGFAIQHDGATRIGATGEIVRPGDTLTYLVTTAAPAYVTVLGRDAAGTITTYVATQRVAAGHDVELTTATRLDATLGHEALVAVFCAAPTPVTSLDPPQGCTVDRLVLEKAP